LERYSKTFHPKVVEQPISRGAKKGSKGTKAERERRQEFHVY